MKRRIFNIKGKRLVEGDANLTNQDEILVKELQDNRVALLENIDGKLVNIGGLEEEKRKRPEIVDTVVKARLHISEKSGSANISLTLGKKSIFQYKNARVFNIHIADGYGRPIEVLSENTLAGVRPFGEDNNKSCILTPYISNNILSVVAEVAKDGYYELENVLDSNRERQLIQIRNGYCVTPFGGGVRPMRFRYPLLEDTLRIWHTRETREGEFALPSDTRGSATKYLHVLFKKNPLFTFDSVDWLNRLSDEELKNHLISVRISRTR